MHISHRFKLKILSKMYRFGEYDGFLKVSPGFTWGYSNSTPIGVVPGFTSMPLN
jgi:hypothetical protein